MGVFKYSQAAFACIGLLFLLLDIVLDVATAVSFYQEEAYVRLGILLLFLADSSVLVQIFSWLWYRYEDFKRETKVSRSQLKLLHVLQLGIYFRQGKILASSFFMDIYDIESLAVLSHDLGLLKFIKTFSENAPQLALMLTTFLQRGQLDPCTVLKAVVSATAIAVNVTMYHRALHSFLPEEKKQQLLSSAVYFFLKLFLISSRLTALALFASVLPCFIFTHFICSWLLLFFFAWRSKTDFMDSPGGEWLYRATVGLIWYFDWFNVAKGRTRYRTLLYHAYILVDVLLLCSLWCWKMSTAPPYFVIPQLYAMITAVSVVSVYILGILLKIVYYKCYHPNLAKDELKGGPTGQGPMRSSGDMLDGDVVIDDDSVPQTIILMEDAGFRSMPSSPAPSVQRCNKRMRKLAENFYS